MSRSAFRGNSEKRRTTGAEAAVCYKAFPCNPAEPVTSVPDVLSLKKKKENTAEMQLAGGCDTRGLLLRPPETTFTSHSVPTPPGLQGRVLMQLIH